MSGLTAPPASRWLVTGVQHAASSGGSLRAARLFRALIERTDAAVSDAHGRRGFPALALSVGAGSRLWQAPLQVAAARLWPTAASRLMRGPVRGRLLDLHDHPRLQLEALEVDVPPDHARRLDDDVRRNLEVFERIAIPSASFGELCGLAPERTIVASNGTDPLHITPGADPGIPVVGMVSGAAPGRGIELLVDAMERVREGSPDAVLRLALSTTSRQTAAYLETIRQRWRHRTWIHISTVPYHQLSAFLASSQVLIIPHPPHAYFDVSTPVKLFDGMAAGRPTIVTPRFEMAAIIQRHDAGIIAGDSADDLAGAITRALADEPLRQRLGANARRAAEQEFDWALISSRLATAILGDVT
jgi:glycosyltransferase involved in cell wall biosynthesis